MTENEQREAMEMSDEAAVAAVAHMEGTGMDDVTRLTELGIKIRDGVYRRRVRQLRALAAGVDSFGKTEVGVSEEAVTETGPVATPDGTDSSSNLLAGCFSE